MNINIRETDYTPILDLEGRLDAHEAPSLSDAISKVCESSNNVAINLTDVHFIDSTGLAALVQGARRLRDGGGDLRLYGLQKSVRIIFELTRLDKVFKIATSEDEVINTYQQADQLQMLKAV